MGERKNCERARKSVEPDAAREDFLQEPDYYIHGTDQVDTIGSAASHGCLRLDPIDAAELAIRVMQASGAKRDSTWYQNAIERGETRTVMLPMKVEMIITG